MDDLKGNHAKERGRQSYFSIAGDVQPMRGNLNAALQKC